MASNYTEHKAICICKNIIREKFCQFKVLEVILHAIVIDLIRIANGIIIDRSIQAHETNNDDDTLETKNSKILEYINWGGDILTRIKAYDKYIPADISISQDN